MISSTFQRGAAIAAALALLFALFGWAAPVSALGSAKASPNDALLIVNKTTNELAYFRDGVLERVFPVATGKTEDLTPEGTFPIVNKIVDRPYYKEKIPGGDPANPLGRRWLGLRVGKTEGTTYAIHGNNNSRSIGKYVSAGCIRMHNDDIEWLFKQIAVGTKVVITSSKLSFEELAAKHRYELLRPFPASLLVDGVAHELRRTMLVYRGVTYLPLRECFELLGGTVQWDAASRTATVLFASSVIALQPGATAALADGEEAALGSPARLVNGALMVPLRDMAALAGWTAQWDAESRSVVLTGAASDPSLF